MLGTFSHFYIAIAYSNFTFCGAWTPSFCEFTQNFSKTSTPLGMCRHNNEGKSSGWQYWDTNINWQSLNTYHTGEGPTIWTFFKENSMKKWKKVDWEGACTRDAPTTLLSHLRGRSPLTPPPACYLTWGLNPTESSSRIVSPIIVLRGHMVTAEVSRTHAHTTDRKMAASLYSLTRSILLTTLRNIILQNLNILSTLNLQNIMRNWLFTSKI